jgi:hypothetical protein
MRVITFTSLYLKKPYGCVYSNAQRAAGLFELLDGEPGQGYALAGADFFVNTALINILVMSERMRNLPMNSHLDSICVIRWSRQLPGSWCCLQVIRLLLWQWQWRRGTLSFRILRNARIVPHQYYISH